MNPSPKVLAARKAIADLVSKNSMTLDTAVTLTDCWQVERPEQLSKKITNLMRRLNSRLFRRKFERHNIALPVVSVIEGGGATGKQRGGFVI